MTNQSTLDHYSILGKIGSGLTSKVKAVQDSETGQTYAAKIYKSLTHEASSKSLIRTADNEIANLQQISHPNIVKLISSSRDGVYTKKNGVKETRTYIVMEMCPNGNFFEIISRVGRFEENICRLYFQQLIGAIEAAHRCGIVHRDLKIENLLLDQDFYLKVTDFGFSANFVNNDQSILLSTRLGTEGYMAPELYMNIKYSGESVDIFAAGVILFIMRSMNPPFSRASMSDRLFEMFIKNNKKFWEMFSRNKPADFYSEEFRNLIMGLLHPNPARRLRISQIKKHM